MPKKALDKPETQKQEEVASVLPGLEDLTPAQQLIIATMIENGLGLSRTELAETAGVDRKTVWSAFQSEKFVEAYRQVCIYLIKDRVGEVLDASLKAARGKSFADRQMLLQMAGLYTPMSRAEVTGKDGKPMQVETIVGIVREASENHTTGVADLD